MHIYRERLAYVGWEDGRITIELVRLTRNGLSYHFHGQRWRRDVRPMAGDACCSECGEVLKISLLSRQRVPGWVLGQVVIVSAAAHEKFVWWCTRSQDDYRY